MATMIPKRFSVKRVLNTVRRHLRLCKKILNGSFLAEQIQPEYTDLIEKENVVIQQNERVEDAYDDVSYADNLLDDAVRNLFGSCEEYDRSNPSQSVKIKVFPEERFGHIVRAPYNKEIEMVNDLIARINSLGEQHELYPHSAELAALAQGLRDSLVARTSTEQEHRNAQIEAEISKENLIRKYEVNYLDARKTFGKTGAERLFPDISTSVSRNNVDEEDIVENEAA